ncbi:MAG TPA: rhomboid family intramembrane serine protease [Acidimicrobiia bacterium]|nr:rhomboid family intramembrane serine protease [Acidimicrobiia bacterium]
MIPLRDDNPTRTKPVVTIVLIAACAYVYFFVQPRTDPAAEEEFLFRNAAIPCEVTHGEPLSPELINECDGQIAIVGLRGDEKAFPDKSVYLALVASMFLHGSILHLLGNMLFLWVFGNNVEERFGKVGYVAFYMVTGLAAAAAHILSQTDSTVPVIGASGAIAGVMGAYLVFFPHARVLTLVPLFIFIQFVYLPAFVVLIGWFVLQFFTNPNTGVAVMAHIGGFVAGAAIGLLARPFVVPPRPAPPPPDLGFGGFGRDPYR